MTGINQASSPQSMQRTVVVYEFLLSLNIAVILKLEGDQKPNRVLGLLDYFEPSLTSKINGLFGLHPHHSLGGNSAFLILALGLACCVFLLLRLSARTTVTQQLLRLGGLLSVVALPGAWLGVSYMLEPVPLTPVLPRGGMMLELIIAAVCVVVFVYGRVRTPGWVGVGLLVLHFGFWTLTAFGGPYFWRAPFMLVFPVVSFASSVAWAVYLSERRLRPARPPALIQMTILLAIRA